MWKDILSADTNDSEPIISTDTQFLIGGLWLFLALFMVFSAAVMVGRHGDRIWLRAERADPGVNQSAPASEVAALEAADQLTAPKTPAIVDPIETGSVATAVPEQPLPQEMQPMPSLPQVEMQPSAAGNEELQELISAEMRLMWQRLDLISQQLTELTRRQDQALERYITVQAGQRDLRALIETLADHEHDWAPILKQHMPVPQVGSSAQSEPKAAQMKPPERPVELDQPEPDVPKTAVAVQEVAPQPPALATPELAAEQSTDVQPPVLDPSAIDEQAADTLITGALPPSPQTPSLFQPLPPPVDTTQEAENGAQEVLRIPRARPERIFATQTEFGVSIGRYGDAAGAADQWRRLREFFPGLVDGKDGVAQLQKQAAGPDSYALVFGPFVNAADAATACSNLQNNGLQCQTAVFSGDSLTQ